MVKDRPLSILIPVLGFGRAGGYRVLSKLADELISHGCRVAFLAPCWSVPPYYPTKAEIHWLDATGCDAEHRPHIEEDRSMGGKIWRVFRQACCLTIGIQRLAGPWDIVLANHSFTAWPVALARTQGSKIYYIQAYEPEFYEPHPGLQKLISKGVSWISYFLPLYRIANAPIYLHYRSCRARTWIPPGLDLRVFHPNSMEFTAGTKQEGIGLTVGCIGRAEPDKGTKEAIEAYREFVKEIPGTHRFRLANFGVPQEWLDGVPGLECVTPLNDEELADYYRSINVILALATQQNGAHHYPVLEAMATNVAVITTGYVPADNSNAWIVGSDPAMAALALVDVYSHPNLVELKCQRAKDAIQCYAWPKVGAKFLKVLGEVYKGHHF